MDDQEQNRLFYWLTALLFIIAVALLVLAAGCQPKTPRVDSEPPAAGTNQPSTHP